MATQENLYRTSNTAERQQSPGRRVVSPVGQIPEARGSHVPSSLRWLPDTSISPASLSPQLHTQPAEGGTIHAVGGIIRAVQAEQVAHGVSASTAVDRVMGQRAAAYWPIVSGYQSSMRMTPGANGEISHAQALAEARKKTSNTEGSDLKSIAAKHLLVAEVEKAKLAAGQPPVRRTVNAYDNMQVALVENPVPSREARERARLETEHAATLVKLVGAGKITVDELGKVLTETLALPVKELKIASVIVESVLEGALSPTEMAEDLATVHAKMIKTDEEESRERARLEAQYVTASVQSVVAEEVTVVALGNDLIEKRELPLDAFKVAADTAESLAALRAKNLIPEDEIVEMNADLKYLLALAEQTALKKVRAGRKGDPESLTVINAADVELPASVDGVHHINVVPAVPGETAEVLLLPNERADAPDEDLVDDIVGWFVFANPDGGIVGGSRSLRAIQALQNSHRINPDWLQIRPSLEGSTFNLIYVMPQQKSVDRELASV